MKMGSFEVTELSPGRWRLFNELTQEAHISYGTSEEIEARAARQTAAWKRKMNAAKGIGSAWRRVRVATQRFGSNS